MVVDREHVSAAAFAPEAFVLRGQAIYLHLPSGVGRAKLPAALLNQRRLPAAGRRDDAQRAHRAEGWPQPSGDGRGQFPDLLDPDRHHVAGLEAALGAHRSGEARRRAGGDQVARTQDHVPTQE